MNLKRLTELLEDTEAFGAVQYPHGIFLNPRTIQEIAGYCRAATATAPYRSTFFGIAIYPLEGVPKGSIWPRAKDGKPDVAAWFKSGARA